MTALVSEFTDYLLVYFLLIQWTVKLRPDRFYQVTPDKDQHTENIHRLLS